MFGCGLLYGDDGDALLARLETLCATAPLDLPLPSETARDRAEVLDRLAQLRTSRSLRRRYVALVGEVWHALRDAWIETAQPVVATAVEARLRLADRAAGWEDAIGEAEHFDGLLVRLVADLAPDAEVAVVPAYFTHRGLLVSLPGVLVVGVRTGPLEPGGAAERARTAALARRLKAVADPTRLAIVATLAEGPRGHRARAPVWPRAADRQQPQQSPRGRRHGHQDAERHPPRATRRARCRRRPGASTGGGPRRTPPMSPDPGSVVVNDSTCVSACG